MHMTCRCGHQFCWICLKDITNHGACASPPIVNQQLVTLERNSKHFSFYHTRYLEHQKSATFAQKHLYKIRLEIESTLDHLPTTTPNDYQFLIDIAELVLHARRSLSHAYVVRFYLYGF